MRVAIVGAGGFVGRHLSGALAADDVDVVALSSTSGAFDLESGLLRDLPDVPDLDAVVYLAQSPYYRELPGQAGHVWNVNVVSAMRAATWARRLGARRFTYASTGNVYAPSFLPRAESDPLRRDDGYALSKVHAEEALSLFARDLDVTSARLFGVYGPGQRAKLVPHLAQAIAEGRVVRIQPHPSDTADTGGLRITLGHVDDVSAVLADLAKAGGPAAINVAGPEVRSLRDLADAIGRRLGTAPRYQFDETPRYGDLIADTTRLSSLTDVRFRELEDGLAQTVDELRLTLR